jgi:hypothetical protein
MATTFLELDGDVVTGGDCWVPGRNLHLTAFYGGTRYGPAVQITVSDPDGHAFVGLTEANVRTLVGALQRWLDGKGDLDATANG